MEILGTIFSATLAGIAVLIAWGAFMNFLDRCLFDSWDVYRWGKYQRKKRRRL